MQIIVRKLNDWAYKNQTFVQNWRTQRLLSFLKLVRPPKQAKIIDLGGSSYMWDLLEHDFEITIVNLPDGSKQDSQLSRYHYVEGDATDLRSIFADKSFDLVYSNSVIEHVGNQDKQIAFANEVYRLADAYWIQTPSLYFPIEIHTAVPFYWQLPQWGRDRLIKSWEAKLPAWTAMIKELRVLSKEQMQVLFPDASIYIERKFWIEKSYCFYKPYTKP
jgi:predicted SAM-dependent methyltransferase